MVIAAGRWARVLSCGDHREWGRCCTPCWPEGASPHDWRYISNEELVNCSKMKQGWDYIISGIKDTFSPRPTLFNNHASHSMSLNWSLLQTLLPRCVPSINLVISIEVDESPGDNECQLVWPLCCSPGWVMFEPTNFKVKVRNPPQQDQQVLPIWFQGDLMLSWFAAIKHLLPSRFWVGCSSVRCLNCKIRWHSQYWVRRRSAVLDLHEYWPWQLDYDNCFEYIMIMIIRTGHKATVGLGGGGIVMEGHWGHCSI